MISLDQIAKIPELTTYLPQMQLWAL